MAELRPYPFAALVSRMLGELERQGSIFDLPAGRFVRGDDGLDLSVSLHGRPAGTPLGPAAGPQTQMAQNIALSWLGGCRILELKTVQVRDDLEIPRPCIDVHTVGLNAEWSQELRLAESLEEYVKGAMLVEMLRSGPVAPADGFGATVYDMSVGYDLEGIRSAPVRAFINGMRDARLVVDRLRGELPAELAHLRDLDYPTRLSDTVTLSTFHGCPPDEIERICEYLMRELGLHTIVKFNPMLLGPAETRRLLHDVLGYEDLHVPDSAFTRDTPWQRALEITGRLRDTARELGLGFGVKLTNTLIVENRRGFLAPGEKEVYLSGQPLHVLAMHLVRRFRREFGADLPISFSAGIDRGNFADAAALGLVPITVCTDLLRKGGYGRLAGYRAALAGRMKALGARTLDEFALVAYGLAEPALASLGAEGPHGAACLEALASGGDARRAAGQELFSRWVRAAHALNTEHYVETVSGDPRYRAAANATSPRKIGRHLKLFDCVTCDICVPVCPNHANFTLHSPQSEVRVVRVVRGAGGWEWRSGEPLRLAEKHQIGNFADFCNDCGNCDVFCPEDGGPYVVKPRFFLRRADFLEAAELDGFWLRREDNGDTIRGRFSGAEYRLEVASGRYVFSGEGFRLTFDEANPAATVKGEGPEEIDLTYCFIMDWMRRAVLDGPAVNYLNSARGEALSEVRR
jgi:putative selenate reductase